MSILAQFEQLYELADRRRSPRRSLRLEAANAPLSAPEMGVVIHDLSLTGFLIETSAPLVVGEHIEVQIPEAGNVEAEIAWNSGSQFGCKFNKPISKAAFGAALLRSPALNSGESKLVADALAEVKTLGSTVERLALIVDTLVEEQRIRSDAAANIGSLAQKDSGNSVDIRFLDPDSETGAGHRLPFGMKLRILLAVAFSFGAWGIVLWALGAFE